MDGVVVPDLTVIPENCGPKTVTFTPRFNTGCDDCNVLGTPVTITAYPEYTTDIVDIAMCGTAYARLIGQDGVEICDQVEVTCTNNGDVEYDSYNFDQSNSPCPFSASGTIECSCTSCAAEAGSITLSGSHCPGTSVTPSVSGHNTDADFTTVILVVDGDNIISISPLGTITLPSICSAFTLYTYNYETSGGSDPSPSSISGIDCSTNCCDLSDPVTVIVQSDLMVSCPNAVNLPACTSSADILTAYNTWKAGFQVTGGCTPITDNKNTIPTLPSAGCGEGFSLNFTLEASDVCHTTALSCSSTFSVAAATPLDLTIPADITVNCGLVPPGNQGDASTSGGCGTPTITYGETITGSEGPCGFTVERTWTAVDACGSQVSKKQVITVSPAPAPTFVNPPQNLNIQCGDPVPPGVDLTISNGQTSYCAITSTISPTTTSMGESTTYTWSYTHPCDGSTIQHTQTISEESDLMSISDIATTCKDNNTDTDPSDDYYSIVFTVTATQSTSTTYTVDIGGTNYGPYVYGEEITIDNYPATGATVIMQVLDSSNSNCGITRVLGPLVSCSNACTMDLVLVEQLACDDNGTPDTNDDFFKVEFSASGANISAEYSLSLAGTFIGTYAYGQEHILDNIPADGASKTIVVVDVNKPSCTDSIKVQSNECSTCNQIADAGMDQTITCDQQIVTLSGLATPDNGAYSWTGPENTIYESKEIQIDQEGTYILNVTYADGCIATDTVLVSSNTEKPKAVIYADPDYLVNCTVSSVSLSTEEEENAIYTWRFNGVTFQENSIKVEEGGDVTLIAIDTINGCQDSTEVKILDLVDYPILMIEDPDTLNCKQESILLKATDSQVGTSILYQWMDANGNPLDGENTNALEVSSPGTYLLQAIDTTNNCSNVDTISVESNMNIPTIVVESSYSLPCDKAYLDIIPELGGTDYEIIWRDIQGKELEDNGGILVIDTVGTYTIECIDPQSFCESRDTITVHPSELPTFALEAIDPNCDEENSGEIRISEISGGTSPYDIKLGTTTNQEEVIQNLSAGVYTVTVTDAMGCSKELEIELEEAEIFEIELEEIVRIFIGDKVELTAKPNIEEEKIDSIYWSPRDSVSCPDCLVTVVEPHQSTAYMITIVDKNGCSVTTRVYVDVHREIDIFVPNIFTPNGDGKNDVLSIYTNKPSFLNTIEFLIYDRWGNIVFKSDNIDFNNPAWGWGGNHLGKPASPGVYAFVLKYSVDGDDPINLTGDFTLMR